MKGGLVGAIEQLAEADAAYQHRLDRLVFWFFTRLPGASALLDRAGGPAERFDAWVRKCFLRMPSALRVAIWIPILLFVLITRLPILVPMAIVRSGWHRRRRNPFFLAHVVAEFLFEETYEWVISPILSEGQLKAESFRYASPPRYVKAWWVMAKTYATVAIATWNAGLAQVVKVAISVWKMG